MGAIPSIERDATMASFTLGTASQATGCAKSTILRAIRAGRISAIRDDHTKEWRIDPAELFRVFPALSVPGMAPMERDAIGPDNRRSGHRAARRDRGYASKSGRSSART